MTDVAGLPQFDPPKALCKGLNRMFAEHGGDLELALRLLTSVQFERFMSSTPKDEQAREAVYFSTLGAREFHAFMASLAAQVPDKLSADFADQQDYS